MPSVLDLAELSNAAYTLPATVDVPRTPPPRPTGGTTSAPAPAWCSPDDTASGGGALGTTASTGALFTSAATPARSSGLLSASGAPATRTWTLAQRWPQSDGGGGGFAAGLYLASDTREKVLAYRGTNPDELSDLFADVQIAGGGIPYQAFPALQAARQAGLGERDWLTGHSLGGALAVLISAELSRRAVTFNAPGVMDSCLQFEAATSPLPGLLAMLRAVARCAAGDRVRNYRIGGDPVSSWMMTGMQSGATTGDLSAPQCGLLNGLCRHSMDTVLEAIRRDAANYAELR